MAKLTKFLSVCAALILTSMTARAADVTADTVVARVNGTDITIGQMIVVRDGLPKQYLQLDNRTLFDGILEQLIQQTALAKLGENRMTKRDKIALEVQRRAYLATSLLDYTAERAVSDEAIQNEYNARYNTGNPLREYHAAHIIVPTEEEAAKLKKEIDGGADFAALAKEHSTDGAAGNGGDLGWFSLDMMVQPFAEAVASMKAGEVRGPIKTEYGWHVVKLIEARLAEAPAIDDIRDDLSNELRQTAIEDRVQKTVDEADVERMADGIDPAVLTRDGILAK